VPLKVAIVVPGTNFLFDDENNTKREATNATTRKAIKRPFPPSCFLTTDDRTETISVPLLFFFLRGLLFVFSGSDYFPRY
jgi:hypothetical protein